MKINSINHNNPNFKAKWSQKTLDLAKEVDKQKGTKLRKELEEALEKNPELKNYGGDDVVLALGGKYHYDIDSEGYHYTACIAQNFNGYWVWARLKPISPDGREGYYEKCMGRCEPYERWILEDMAEDQDVKSQILNTVSKAENFTAGFIDSFGNFFTRRTCLKAEDKCRLFDTFFGPKE